MNTLSERITYLMQKHDVKNIDIANACKINPASVSDWVSGKTKSMNGMNLLHTAKLFGVRQEWLGQGKGPIYLPEGGNVAELMEDKFKKGRMVPVISWVQAGEWCEAIDNFQPGAADDFQLSNFGGSEYSFCLRVVGTSMWPEYAEGEIIEVDPEAEPRHNNDVVVRTPTGEVSFKRLQVDSGKTYLLALNPDWPERIIKIPEGSHICGTVIGSWRKRR